VDSGLPADGPEGLTPDEQGPAGGDVPVPQPPANPPANEVLSEPAVARGPRRRRRVVLAAVAALALLGGAGLTAALSGSPSAPASDARLVSPPQPVDGRVLSVSVASADSAWAVGVACELCGESASVGRALILHWNGTAWSQASIPGAGGASHLSGVISGPGGTAWAVGYYCPSDCGSSLAGDRTLVLHWNGRAWSRVSSPSPGAGPGSGFSGLASVSVGPRGTAWAVGDYYCASCGTAAEIQPLILHWIGGTWSQVASPVLPSAGNLNSVTSGPGGSAWAAGSYCPATCGKSPPSGSRALILRWDGTAWSQVAGPGDNEVLAGVAVGPAGTAWATGFNCASACQDSVHFVQTFILRWDGSGWSQVPAPRPGYDSSASGAGSGPGGSAYVSGIYYCSCKTSSVKARALLLSWNGTSWAQVSSPSPGGPAYLAGVSSSPDGSVWAAGWYCTSGCGTGLETDQTLFLNWKAAPAPRPPR
jgi:hypothetical protein